jgi:hypothetical protein
MGGINMGPEEMKELIKTTIEEVNFWNSIILAIIPVVATTITTILVNIIYDVLKRKKEFLQKFKIEELKELYLPLYCMISQSEYIRNTINKLKDTDSSIESAPFIHLVKKHTKTSIGKEGIKIEEFKKDDELTLFDEKYMVNMVVDKSKYASAKLIKLAIAYRFIIDNRDTTNQEIIEIVEKEYNNMVIEFIKEVIVETNKKLKYCKMNYNKEELKLNKNKVGDKKYKGENYAFMKFDIF